MRRPPRSARVSPWRLRVNRSLYSGREGDTEEAGKAPPKGRVAGMRTSVLVLCAAAPAAAAAFTPVALPCVARRSSASAITTMVCVHVCVACVFFSDCMFMQTVQHIKLTEARVHAHACAPHELKLSMRSAHRGILCVHKLTGQHGMTEGSTRRQQREPAAQHADRCDCSNALVFTAAFGRRGAARRLGCEYD